MKNILIFFFFKIDPSKIVSNNNEVLAYIYSFILYSKPNVTTKIALAQGAQKD